ncbi:hypothetical protein AMJ80_08325 [bacterium SM23_31]|nr:MAG: hypothetical protein AMJ80_08325 [bacterium SM23_31]
MKSDFIVKTDLSKHLTPKEKLGKEIFFDKNLSSPAGESCATCHDPIHGFEDIKSREESGGAVKTRAGNRNAPAAAYAAFSPYFHYSDSDSSYVGGQFWDGRAATLAEQAKGPFLNPLEMNNTDKSVVVKKIRIAAYANLFDDVYGPNSLENVETAYDFIVDAIANYEETAELNPFDSKYDSYLAGKEQLTEQELLGLQLFEDEKKGRCAACHPSKPDKQGNPPMFTDYTYDNLGVPRNPDNPFYKMPKEFNPKGENWIDFGLGTIVKKESENGKFKVPTLRNIDLTAPYSHNGYFKTLKEIVHFYNTRDTEKWPAPEVSETVNKKELGHLGLTDEEEDAIIAFLKTVTDGYNSSQNRSISK